MGSPLHQALRSLCSNTEWKYSIFWKLKHRARMMLTWEDAYYDNHGQHDPSENKWFSEMVGNFHDGHYSHDPLGLAVAMMTYHVYSLGEGIVGQVAVTGKHLWILADKHATDSTLASEHCDGWQSQFSAGIRTIAVVAVGPHGVVQLGSLNKIGEDLKLVTHVREIFSELQDSLLGHIPCAVQYSVESSSCLSQSDIPTRSSGSAIFHDCTIKDRKCIWLSKFPSPGKHGDHCFVVPRPEEYPKRTLEMINTHGGLEHSMSGFGESVTLPQSTSEIFDLEWQNVEQTKLATDGKCEGEIRGFRDQRVGLEDLLDHKQNGMFCESESLNMGIQKELEKNWEFQTYINFVETPNTSFRFSAGCELYEALGPAYLKQSTYCDLGHLADNTNTETTVEMPEGMDGSSLLTSNCGSEHLLEAVVANVCPSNSYAKSEKSCCKDVHSLLTAESEPPPSDVRTTGSVGYSFDRSSIVEEDTSHCLNSSGACGVGSSKGYSSSSPSRFSEQLERPQEPGKMNKKRARTGENCRPRPRDRQLIQDRIKELRELVPNGSKCSIDSLLERTIKHMLFMQSMTKHAEKLNKCTKSKLLDKETGIRASSSNGQGSSWAVEVGSPLKVCPIMVENIYTNGLMLIEMLCEECSHFLEITEAIKSLGLTILRGVTEAYGEKTWMCFVIEDQNNKSMHRMDVLWSLIQILQSGNKI
ncbi:unnamed protein product [Ilex paraguariensis]|uniref:BHLH domain-containing protein n=1 Tax=Ilex paraguariensis TaxID=185542 RepID=A0ABC8RYH0_9AQUA